MAIPSSHPISMKMRSPYSSLATSLKFRTLVHNFIFSYLCRLNRTFTKAKSIIIELIKEKHLSNIKFFEPLFLKKNKNKNKNNIFFGSFRLHYNWFSSHVVPVTSPGMQDAFTNHVYYDSRWNLYIDHDMVLDSQLSGYLHWLEEKKKGDCGVDRINEIDLLADKFITNCHQKFVLEKQEWYKRFQEMMARSV